MTTIDPVPSVKGEIKWKNDGDITIPQEYVDLCAKIAALCGEAGLRTASFQFDPGYRSKWRSNITMTWTSGRHEDSVDYYTLSSTINVSATVRADAP